MKSDKDSQSQVLLVKKEDEVCYLTLNRPEVGNALNLDLIDKLSKSFLELDNDTTSRVVVLAAKGKNFCSGADLKEVLESSNGSISDEKNLFKKLQVLLDLMSNFSKPIITIVQGACIGGGIGVVACCDLVLADKDSYFSFSEVRLGLVPAIISPYVVQMIGLRASQKLFLTADKFSASEAVSLGLISEQLLSSQIDLRLRELLSTLKKASNLALVKCKELLNYYRVSYHPLDINQKTFDLIKILSKDLSTISRIEEVLSKK